MKNSVIATFFIGIFILGLTSCKTEFEKIRAGGDMVSIHKKAFEYYDKEEYLKAQSLFEIVINSLRGKVEAEKVYFYYAYTHYHLNKFVLGSYYFKNFSTTFPNSQYREEADFMTAYSNYKLSPSYRLDQSYSEKAIDGFQIFVNTYPQSKRVQECNKLIDELRKKMEKKAYAQAELYYDLKQYQSATHSFENMLKDYPETKDAEKIRYMIVKASYLLASNSVLDKQEERFETTQKNSSLFMAKYADSRYTNEIKSIYNESNNKLKDLSNDGY